MDMKTRALDCGDHARSVTPAIADVSLRASPAEVGMIQICLRPLLSGRRKATDFPSGENLGDM